MPDSEPVPPSGLNNFAAYHGRKALRRLAESLALVALFAVWAAFWIGFIVWLTA